MKVRGVKCLSCGDFIYSRANHDLRPCTCKMCLVDGGQEDQLRICGDKKYYEFGYVEVPVTLKKLYKDWNKGKDKYGRIKSPYQMIYPIEKKIIKTPSTETKAMDCTQCSAFPICSQKPVREDYEDENQYLIDLECGVWDCQNTIAKLCKEKQKLTDKAEALNLLVTGWVRETGEENKKLRQEKIQYIELLKEWKDLVCSNLSEGCCPSCEECLFGKLKEQTDNILREVAK